ncbi:MAG: hypothetical protein QXI85_07435 [Desulfurococcaceae archaeon]
MRKLLEHVFNTVYTVLGGLTASLVRWFLESRRRIPKRASCL